MKVRLVTGAMALLTLFTCTTPRLSAAPQDAPAADNTKVNKQDRMQGAMTADNAKNGAGDRDVMQKIRKSLMDDKSLSTYAHNVKVIAKDGKVTLKGPVRSDDEKQSVEQKASAVAGAGNVTNQLTVKPDKTKKAS